MFSSFKRMYNFRPVANSKFFIFLYLSCFSFFVASGSSKKRMSLTEMRESVFSIREKLEKLYIEEVEIREIRRRIEELKKTEEEGSSFEKSGISIGDEVDYPKEKVIKDLARLILKAYRACLTNKELESLKDIKNKCISNSLNPLDFKDDISNRFNRLLLDRRTEPLATELENQLTSRNIKNKQNNEEDAKTFKRIDCCSPEENLSDSGYTANTNNYDNIRTSDTVNYIATNISENNNGNNKKNKEEVLTIEEKKQLWDILNGIDYKWDSFCKENQRDVDFSLTNSTTGTNDNDNNRENIIAIYNRLLLKYYPEERGLSLFMRILNKSMFLKGLIENQEKGSVNYKEYEKLVKMYDAILTSMSESLKYSTLEFMPESEINLNYSPFVPYVCHEFKINQDHLDEQLEYNRLKKSNLFKEAFKKGRFFKKLFDFRMVPSEKDSNKKEPTANTHGREFEIGDYFYFWFVEKDGEEYRNLLLMYNKKDKSKEVEVYSFKDVYKIFFMKYLNNHDELFTEEEKKRIENELWELDGKFVGLLGKKIANTDHEIVKGTKLLEGLDWNWELTVDNSLKEIQKQNNLIFDEENATGQEKKKKKFSLR